MKEFNNRDIAKKHAEYITGDELRRYVANKVSSYIKDPVSVFDGACGSGQLCQYVNLKFLRGVEIQEKACECCRENFPNSHIENMSFFNYQSDEVEDIVIMNPPFSLKFKELSEEERYNIQKEFTWKKSGVVDDIFLLKSLQYCKRYAFYIMFTGICYRKAEAKLRELVGNCIKEINLIENAFEDTTIGVVFLVIDKAKTDTKMTKEVYDCKAKMVMQFEELEEINWQVPHVQTEDEVIDIDEVNKSLDDITINKLRLHLEILNLRVEYFNEPKEIVNDFKERVIRCCFEH